MNGLHVASGESTIRSRADRIETVRAAVARAFSGDGEHTPIEYLLMPVAAAGFEVSELSAGGMPATDIVRGTTLATEQYRNSTGRDLGPWVNKMLNLQFSMMDNTVLLDTRQ